MAITGYSLHLPYPPLPSCCQRALESIQECYIKYQGELLKCDPGQKPGGHYYFFNRPGDSEGGNVTHALAKRADTRETGKHEMCPQLQVLGVSLGRREERASRSVKGPVSSESPGGVSESKLSVPSLGLGFNRPGEGSEIPEDSKPL